MASATAICLTLLAAHPARAARLLRAYVEVDGKVVLHTYYQDGGRANAATVWRYWKNDPIMVDEDLPPLDADPGDPQQATLQGNVRIWIEHTGDPIAESEVDSLTLQRADATSQAWHLSDAEVERTAELANLGPATTAPTVSPQRVVLLFSVVAGVLVAVVLIAVILVATLMATRRRGAESSE